MTRESLYSVLWRLVPYALNQLERSGPGGVEASAALWELPQFAAELLVILPCVQVWCSRAKILALECVDAALPPAAAGASAAAVEAAYVPNVLAGCWERRPEQARLRARLAANRRVVVCAGLICLAAAANALVVPLALEAAALRHPLSAAALQGGGLETYLKDVLRRLPDRDDASGGAPRRPGLLSVLLRAAARVSGGGSHNTPEAGAAAAALAPLVARFEAGSCFAADPEKARALLRRHIMRHHLQLKRMEVRLRPARLSAAARGAGAAHPLTPPPPRPRRPPRSARRTAKPPCSSRRR